MDHPEHLDPSPLGTKEYWETYYQRSTQELSDKKDTANEEAPAEAHEDPDEQDEGQEEEEEELESWFSESGAPEKIVDYLTNSANLEANLNTEHDLSRLKVLDIGTGNGSLLFLLAENRDGIAYKTEDLVGIDYSAASVTLARRLAAARKMQDIRFEVCDVFSPSLLGADWIPEMGFDIVVDKGTFDAISLSDETYRDEHTGKEKRICEKYPGIVTRLVRPGGFIMVTSCNWTEDELIKWFTGTEERRSAGGIASDLQVHGKVEYPKFRFGGVEGQEVASVCFKRVELATDR